MNLIAEFYLSLTNLSQICVQGLVDGYQFRLLVDDIAYFLGVSNEGDVTYFENVTSNVLFQRYIPTTKLSGSVLKSRVRYKNRVNAKDLTLIAFNFQQIMVTNVLP